MTVEDGFGQSRAINPFVNVQFSSPPTFSSPDHTTFVAGTTGNFVIVTTGAPTAAVTLDSGTIPSNLGLVPHGDGTAVINGDPSINDGGQYPIVLKATNAHGNVTQAFTLQVDVAPAIT